MTPDEQIVRLLQKDILLEVQNAYGITITRDFKEFIEKLKSLYRSIDLSQYESVIAVYRHSELRMGMKVIVDNIYQHCNNHLAVNFLDDDGYAEVITESFDYLSLSEDSFVYRWDPKERLSDVFIIKGVEKPYSEEPCTNGLSYFSIKTYKELDSALLFYRDSMALDAKQTILCDALRRNRLFFKNAPECLLQEALYEFLTASLRNTANVKREVNVDNSHPVDISITFKSTSHIALIEIKWIGRSLNDEESKISVSYSDRRANEGAKQLIDYIDANRESFPSNITAGYLVVYDLRRNNNNDATKDRITHCDGDFYQLKELAMNPDYKAIRTDYKGTFRFFIKVARNAYSD